MEKSKLITILKTFSDSEVKELGKFLEGTSYRKEGAVFSLFKYLKKYHPELPTSKIEKAHIQKVLFKKTSKNYRRLFDVMYQLSIVMEDFLILKQLEIQKTDRDFLLLEAYKTKKLDKLFFQKIGSIDKRWETEKEPGIKHLHDDYRLKEICLLHPSYSLISEKKINAFDLIDSIDLYHFITKLNWVLCASMTYTQLSTPQKNQHLISEVIKIAAHPKFKTIPQVFIYSKLIDALSNNRHENYTEIKNAFFSNIQLFNEYEKLDIYNSLNILLSKSPNRAANYIQEMFELNRFATESKLILEDGYLYIVNFQNIVSIACIANELNWAKEFIAEFKGYIKEDSRTNATLLCEAILGLYSKNFEEGIVKISQLTFTDPIINIIARGVQLQCYYELEEDYYELLMDSTKSFTLFLNRNQSIADSFRKSALNFISAIKKLKRLKNTNSKMSKVLKEEIKNESQLINKYWLLQKIAELEA